MLSCFPPPGKSHCDRPLPSFPVLPSALPLGLNHAQEIRRYKVKMKWWESVNVYFPMLEKRTVGQEYRYFWTKAESPASEGKERIAEQCQCNKPHLQTSIFSWHIYWDYYSSCKIPLFGKDFWQDILNNGILFHAFISD